ncbi:discoidin domain-containing protein [Flindersiella endophytica]
MKRALVIALAALLGTYFLVNTGPADTADAAEALLSQGRPVTASSTESSAFPASAAVDGNLGTRWSSAFSDPQTLQVDLGSSVPLTRVVLTWETAYARAFTIQVSADGTNWTTVHTTTAGTGGVQTLTVSGTGRYVRLNATQRATQWGVSLWEFQVYGDTGGTGGSGLLSYGKPAVASSSQNDGSCFECTPARAFDHDPASRWATSATTGWVDPGWIYVDLGATATIQQVVLQWDPAYATAYQIQVSPNAGTWTTIYSTTSGRGFKETLNVSGTGRYVRMYGTARSGPYGYSLWEFQVYGTGGNPTSPPSQPPDPAFPATRLVWSDEFNGAAGTRPDAAKWTIDPGTGQNNEQQYYTDNANAQLDGTGSLVIEARRESAGGREYTSHRMNTSNKLHVQYGRIEARIRVPKGNGLWPAFWMLGADFLNGRPWPYCGEVDIMEVLGRNTTQTYATLHAPAYNGGGGYGQVLTGADLSAGFHVWSVEWDSQHMTFRLDDQVVFVASKSTAETTRGPWIFDHPFYIILNLAVGGDFPGPVDGTTPFPSRMYVDYVRVYQ